MSFFFFFSLASPFVASTSSEGFRFAEEGSEKSPTEKRRTSPFVSFRPMKTSLCCNFPSVENNFRRLAVSFFKKNDPERSSFLRAPPGPGLLSSK